jgi:predicted DCC family thiol-disulfide oxidoreductase YuxK
VATSLQPPETRPIILYDGVCGLCNRFNQFVLKRDRKDLFRFASLQSAFASSVLVRHGAEPRKLDTIYVVIDCDQPTERLLSKSHAILFTLQQLGGAWRIVRAFRMLPRFILDIGYDLVAHNRYRIFGKYETCLVPEEKHRQKFIDV